jgi:hypothetical protein
MSRLPSVVTSIANEERVSKRTVQRRCASGKEPGMCRTKGGHWRLRKRRKRQKQQFSSSSFSSVPRLTHFLPDSQPPFPPGEEWERLKKSLVADALPRLMLLASQHDKAYHDKALKLAWLYAGITDEDVHDVLLQPDPLTRARNRAALKKRDYRKWQLLCQRKFVVGQPPYIKLLMKVEFLRANGAKGFARSRPR